LKAAKLNLIKKYTGKFTLKLVERERDRVIKEKPC